MKFRYVMLCTLIFAAMFAITGRAQVAEVVFYNGKIWTVDKNNPQAEAIAVAGERILELGTNEKIKKYIGENTRHVDLKGKILLPGFIDNHVHFVGGGLQLLSIDLRQAKNEEEFARLLGQHAQKNPGKWITGGDWDHENWSGARLPTKELIDPYTADTPVFVSRLDGHMGLANSLALRLAGVDKNTPDQPGGTIVRDSVTGEPTGILKDEAMSLVYRMVPTSSEEERITAAKAALAEARRLGVTSIQDITSPADLRIYQILKERGELSARIDCRLPIAIYQSLVKTGIQAHFGDNVIRVGGIKAFADGSLGSSTALFFEPYDQDPNTRGLAMDILSDGSLEKWAVEADKAKLQLSVHAIGDAGNSRTLDIFEIVIRENPGWDRRFRIEHAQHIHPKDFERFAELGVIASVHPYHLIDDGRWAEKRIGKDRLKTSYPIRTFLDKGVHVCFGTDWNVAPLNPLWGIYAAVTRRTLDGKNPGGWVPEQKITVAEAIECYTINSAYASFDEDIKGSLEKGKLADFVVLSDDILSIDPAKIWDVTVEMTVLGGEIIFQRR